VLVLIVLLAPGISEARAATTCSGSLHGRIAGPIRVPAGQSCKLAPGTVVAGKTSVFGGSLTAHDVTFAGDVFATNALAISIDHSSIGLSLKLARGRGPIDLRGDTIGGSTSLIDNVGAINIFGGRLGTVSCLISGSIPHFHNVSGASAAIARCVHSAPTPVPVAPPPGHPIPVAPSPPPVGVPCQPIPPGIMHPDLSQVCLPSGPVAL